MHLVSLADLFKLTRFWNLIIIAIAQYLAAAFLLDFHTAVITDVRLFILTLSTVLIAAAGYVINDYYDIKIDLINKPDRVVIGKSLARRYAILIHTGLSVAGIFLGFILSWQIGAINTACVFFLWLYSNQLKREPLVGNITVALLTGLAVFLVNRLYNTHNDFIAFYSVFAFFMTLVREIVKDMEDMKGDSSFGCKTLPIVWGVRKTKWLLYLLLLFFILGVAWFNFNYALAPPIYIALYLLLPLAILSVRLFKADTVKEYSQLSQVCKVIMLLGIASMIFI